MLHYTYEVLLKLMNCKTLLSCQVALFLILTQGCQHLPADDGLNQPVTLYKEYDASPKIDSSIQELISEREKGRKQASALAKKRRLSIRNDSVAVNIMLITAEVHIDTQKLLAIGVQDYLRAGKFASGYVPILNIPELARIDGVSRITRTAQISID